MALEIFRTMRRPERVDFDRGWLHGVDPAVDAASRDVPPGPPYGSAPFNGAAPRPLPPNLAAANDSASQLVRQLNDLDEHRKVLLDQVQAMKKQLKERDDNVQRANYEMEESTRSMKRNIDEFHQWQAEMDDLRERLRKLEDYRATLKPLIEEIIHQLDREKEPPKTFRLPGN